MNDGHETLLKLGHYEIIRRIGQGGMGDVYLATDSTLDRTVAIKVLPAEFSREPDFVRRFQAEANAAARLTHPNIVPIHAIGEENGRHFFVMQHVIGQSLADRLRVRPKVPVHEALVIIDQVVSGLAAAHRSGLIHRDIKPGNVLLDEEHGRALLADFGLVKSVDPIGNHTQTGVILGTADYMSPEQGLGKQVDQRSDLYSLGVMLFRMLAGHLPFEAESPTAMIFQHVHETPPELHKVNTDIPQEVSVLIAKLVAKAPADRYQSADDLLLALRSLRREIGLLDASQIVSATASGPSTANTNEWNPRLSIRERIALLLKRRVPELAEHLLNTQQQVDVAVNEHEERCLQLECLLADAQFVYDDLTNQAKEQREAAAKWRQQGEAEPEETLRQAAFKDQALCEEIVEDLERQAAAQQDELETIRLQFAEAKAKLLKLTNQRDLLSARLRAAQGPTDGHDSPSLTPTKILVVAAIGIVLAVVGFFVVGSFFRASDPAVAKKRVKNGEEKAANADKEASDAETAGGQQRFGMETSGVEYPFSEIEMGPVTSLVMSPRTKMKTGSVRFSIATPDGAIRRFTVARDNLDVAEVHRINLPLKTTYDLAYSPDGNRLGLAHEDGTIQVIEAVPGRVLRTLPVAAKFLKFTRDGGRLWIGDRSSIREWNFERDEDVQRIVLGDQFGDVTSLDWLQDGSLVLLGTLTEGAPSCGLWNIAQQRPVLMLSDVTSPTTDVRFVSRGSQAIIVSSKQAQLRNLNDGSLVRNYGSDTTCIALTTDRLRLITGGLSGSVEVWNLQTNESVEKIKLHQEEIQHLAVSQDGGWVVAVSRLGRVAVRELQEHKPLGQLYVHRELNSWAKIRVSPSGVSGWKLERDGDRRMFATAERGAVAYSRDSGRLVRGSGPERGVNEITVTDLKTRSFDKVLRRFSAHEESITQLRFTTNGRHLLSSSRDGTVVGWELQSEQPVFSVNVGSPVNDFDVTSENRLITADDNQRVRMWDYIKGVELGSFDDGHNLVVRSIDFSHDGKWAVSGGDDRRLIVWNVDDLTKEFELTGHSAPVTSAVLSKDGTTILSGCEDGVVRLWSVSERRLLREFLGHIGPVWSVDIGRNGDLGVSAGEDSSVRVWDLKPVP